MSSLDALATGSHESLGSGVAGTALAHIARAQAIGVRPVAARMWLRAMLSKPVTAGRDAGLYFGAPAVAFVLHTAQLPGFQTMLDELDTHINALTARRLAAAYERIDRGELATTREYDLISGLTGLGIYHLVRHGNDSRLRAVLEYLVALSEPVYGCGEALPGCWSSAGPTGRADPRWPSGHLNLGMAHGAAGVLALLSGTMRRGIQVDGQAKAIAEFCELFDRHRLGNGPSAWWPGTLSFDVYTRGESRQRTQPRPSWCYGTPGQARALQLAGLALKDKSLMRTAGQALAGCVADHSVTDQFTDVSLCHGWAGLVQTLRRAEPDADDPDLVESALRTALRGMEDHLTRLGTPRSSGLLEGAPGILLAQEPPALSDVPAWDACLMLTV